MTEAAAPMTDAPHWHVTAQQEEQAPGAAGTYTKGVRIYFQLDAGPSGSVFVPKDQLTPDHVREVIAAHAMTLYGIHNLSA